MFQVKSINKNDIHNVYGAYEYCGEIYFLMYSDHWYWIQAKDFVPYINIADVPIQPYPLYEWRYPPYGTWYAKPFDASTC